MNSIAIILSLVCPSATNLHETKAPPAAASVRVCSTCPYESGCKTCCEASRFHSNVPKGHCQAICESTRHVADNAVDVVVSIGEWARKARNTLRARRDSCQ